MVASDNSWFQVQNRPQSEYVSRPEHGCKSMQWKSSTWDFAVASPSRNWGTIAATIHSVLSARLRCKQLRRAHRESNRRIILNARCSFYFLAGVLCLLGSLPVLSQTANSAEHGAIGVVAKPTAVVQTGPSGILSTVAGNGYHGELGDGGLAINAELLWPNSVAVDAAGNVYISDKYANVVRKVTASTGKISIYAGTFGSAGYSGDKGPATSAKLDYPAAVASDAAGNIYIADGYNEVIRRVDASTHIITTVAGTGEGAFRPHEGGCGAYTDSVAATTTGLCGPWAVAVDSKDNFYIIDYKQVIYKVTASTGIIKIVAGSGVNGYSGDGGPALNAKFDYPQGIAVDSAGNIYVVDFGNCAIRKIDNGTGNISSLVGTPSPSGFGGTCGLAGDGGPASAAEIAYPYGVAVDSSGNVFIGDSNNNAVRMVAASNGNIYTVAGSHYGFGTLYGTPGYFGDGGPADYGALWFPEGVATDALGNVYIADEQNNVVRKVTAAAALPSQAPVISPAGAVDTDAVNVTITSPVPHATIYYTTDGSIPTTKSKVYGGPIGSFTTGIITAFATIPGQLDTPATMNTYFYAPPPTITPAATENRMLVIASPITVNISDANKGAKIYYNLNNSAAPTPSATLCKGAFSVSTTTYIRAIAAASTKDFAGNVLTGTSQPTVLSIIYAPAPVIAPGTENITTATPVTITDANSKAKIYYTTDGSDPTQQGATVKLYSGPVSISATTTLKAAAQVMDMASNVGWSAISKATYTRK